MTITVEGPGGATVEFPEGTPTETINKVMTDHFGGGKKEASGLADGMVHGAQELVNGPAETLKRYAGVGPGRKDDPNYVPANVTNGSWNPANWSPSQLPQKIAEMAPSVVPDIASASLGAKIGKRIGPKSALAGALIGGTLSALGRTAGDTAKEATVARTGDENAESSTADLVRGGATAAAGAGVNALLPTRFVSGLNKAGTVGSQGLLDAFKRYLGTTAIGGAGAVASDATTQAGLTLGTPKGLTVDPSSFPESAVGGAATAGTLAAPQLASGALRASNMREFGGANKEATTNYATRLDTAGDGRLGNAARDATAHESVKTDLKNELRDAATDVRKASGGLHPDVDNALQRAQDDKPLTPKDLSLIESGTSGTPDGANAAYLARTMRVAQLAQGKGSYSPKSWAGGISGTLDDNLGYMLNPTRMLGGGIASLAGMHLLGLSNPLFAGSVAGGYGVARGIDSMTGMRSPAKSFAEHFADQSAQLRMPTTPSAPAPNQGPAPSAPWGPRPPMAGPTGPTVMPQAAPQQNAAPGPWGPRPLATASVPPTGPQAPAPAASTNRPVPADAIVGYHGSRDIIDRFDPSKTRLDRGVFFAEHPELASRFAEGRAVDGDPARIYGDDTPQEIVRWVDEHAGSSEAKRIKKLIDEAERLDWDTDNDRKSDLAKNINDEISKLTGLDQSFGSSSPNVTRSRISLGKNHKADMGGRFDWDKEREAINHAKSNGFDSVTFTNTGAADNYHSILNTENIHPYYDQATNAALGASKLKAKTIKKSNGKMKGETPEPPAARPEFEPYPEEHLYPKDITAKQYAAREMGEYKASSPKYLAKAEMTAQRRIDKASELTAQFPQYKHTFSGLLRQLHRIGRNPDEVAAAVDLYASHVPDDVGTALREAFH